MTQPTITEFLLARIAEDESLAQAAFPEPTGRWSWRTVPKLSSRETHHIARHDPARVLAECEAKRRIVQLHDDALKRELGNRDASAFGADLMHEDVMRALAAVYADHPDYREEWRP